MRNRAGLVRHILGRACASDRVARGICQRADVAGVDLLVFITHRFSLAEDEVYERAAAYCGLAFAPRLPHGPIAFADKDSIPGLGQVKALRARLFDRDVLFTAPGAEEMLALAAPALARWRTRVCVLPPRVLRAAAVRHHAAGLMDHARQHLVRRWPEVSASLEVTRPARLLFVLCLLLFGFGAALTPFVFGPALVPLLAAIFVPPAWFRLSALFDPPDARPRFEMLADDALPVYSVLIPLRNEAHMVPQLAIAMQALDYPAEKLDIKFIVEAASTRTVHAVRAWLSDPRFELIVVPERRPHTKPKALNYALPMARGAHAVIYDAEDIPEPDQLRMAASRFAAHPGVDCLQAELVIDNARESWLTALFAAEYSGLFGVMLPALGRWRLPIPLGGTSNHFRIEVLREVGGWDSFNVTEDADLGVRLARCGRRVETLNSRTFEEAPVTLRSWLSQRTRWMKGWMQTFIVHNRHPRIFLRDAGWRNFLAFQIYVGGMIASAPLHTIFTVMLIVRLLAGAALGLPSDGGWRFDYMFVLFAGYTGAFAHAVAGALRLGRRGMVLRQIFLPAYWFLIGIAGFRAGFELVARPHFWAKTAHGRTRFRRNSAPQHPGATPAPAAGPARARRGFAHPRKTAPAHGRKNPPKAGLPLS